MGVICIIHDWFRELFKTRRDGCSMFGWNVTHETSPVGSMLASVNITLIFLIMLFYYHYIFLSSSKLGCELDQIKIVTGKTNR